MLRGKSTMCVSVTISKERYIPVFDIRNCDVFSSSNVCYVYKFSRQYQRNLKFVTLFHENSDFVMSVTLKILSAFFRK